MSETAPLPAVSPQTGDFLGTLGAALWEAFGVSFDLWLEGPPWTRWSPRESAEDEHGSLDDPSGIIEVLEAAVERADVSVVDAQPGGRHLTAIPFEQPGGQAVVAVATLSMTPQELLRKLSVSVRTQLCQRRELEENHLDLESYAEQISEYMEELTYLQGLAEYLDLCDASQSLAEITQATLPLLRGLVKAEAIVVVPALNDPTHGGRHAAQVDSPAVWGGPRIIDDQACCKLVDRFKGAAAQQPVIKNHLGEQSESADFPLGLESFLLAPMAKGECCVGWLLALNRVEESGASEEQLRHQPRLLGDDEFGTTEAALMVAAGVMFATHWRNVGLFREKEKLLVGIVRALINVLDAKDSYTFGHSDRVALIAKRLGAELGLDHQQCEQLYLAGLLHDIGKIGVPDEVLLKPGKLTDSEFAQVKRHSRRGYSILEHFDQLSNLIPGILHHHERFDGKGYPAGLANEEVPLVARIVAVADAYDAMSSERPYRNAMPDEKLESILKEGAGTQWDSRVVEALFRALSDVRKIRETSERHVQDILAVGQESSAERQEA
jgi:HD-GYP domain-containing protein (c-di-GMP phosphodiesterase class II)